MCTVSSSLRLCTCETVADDPGHYWELARFVEGKNDFRVGDIMPPPELSAEQDEANYAILLRLLNEDNPFDTPLSLEKNDRLALHFSPDPSTAHVSYGFRFDGRKWVRKRYVPFDWDAQHEEIEGGTIEEALAEKQV